jgi:hypothetical protein
VGDISEIHLRKCFFQNRILGADIAAILISVPTEHVPDLQSTTSIYIA